MKRFTIVFTIFLLSLILASCQPADSDPPDISAQETAGAEVAQVQPTATAVPTEQPPDPWRILRQDQPEHQPLYVAFLNGAVGVAGCGKNSQPSLTKDAGQTWTQLATGFFCPSSVDIVDSQSIWLCNEYGVFLSKDGGQTIGQMYAPYHGCQILNFADNDHGWSSYEQHLAATTDGALRWVEIEKPDGMGEIAAISLSTPQNGYVLDRDGLLFVTKDGGESWSSIDLGISASGLEVANMDGRPAAAMHFWDEEKGVIVLNIAAAGVAELLSLHTADGGQSWGQFDLQLNPGAVYLSHDGQYLTVAEHGGAAKVTILKYQAPIED